MIHTLGVRIAAWPMIFKVGILENVNPLIHMVDLHLRTKIMVSPKFELL